MILHIWRCSSPPVCTQPLPGQPPGRGPWGTCLHPIPGDTALHCIVQPAGFAVWHHPLMLTELISTKSCLYVPDQTTMLHVVSTMVPPGKPLVPTNQFGWFLTQQQPESAALT